jgi:hypothetical protein
MIFRFLTYTLFILLVSASVSAQTTVTQGKHDYLTFLLESALPFDTTHVVFADDETTTENSEESWKKWATVENYKYGKDRGSLPMIADLNSLHPYFRDRITELIRICREQGIELAVVESFRTHAKQSEYFGMGRKYTRSKGGKSKHQYGLAVDVVPIVDSVAVWDNISLWRKIGVTGERLGLRWGGRWRAPYDPAHFEWSGGISTYELANGAQPFIPKSKASLYPCLEEELVQLQKNWEAWETEQAVSARNNASAKSSSVKGSVGQEP